MGQVYDQFERTLHDWRVKYADRPKSEILRLCLLALEREEIVTIAYREALMVQRLASMPIPPAVRDLIRHARLWAWKDEEMHAIYIRGAIFRLGNAQLRLRACVRAPGGGRDRRLVRFRPPACPLVGGILFPRPQHDRHLDRIDVGTGPQGRS